MAVMATVRATVLAAVVAATAAGRLVRGVVVTAQEAKAPVAPVATVVAPPRAQDWDSI